MGGGGLSWVGIVVKANKFAFTIMTYESSKASIGM